MDFLKNKAIETLITPLLTLALTQALKTALKFLKTDTNNNGTPDLIEKLPNAFQAVVLNVLEDVKTDVCGYAVEKEIIEKSETETLSNAIDKILYANK